MLFFQQRVDAMMLEIRSFNIKMDPDNRNLNQPITSSKQKFTRDVHRKWTLRKFNSTLQKPIALKDHLPMPKDPLNPPTVSLYFSDLLPT